MILQALTSYYEALAARGKIARPGWSPAKISYALEIDENGKLLDIHSLMTEQQRGKKTVIDGTIMSMPTIGEAKGNGIKSNFLWENASYLLGIDMKGKPLRTESCFLAAKELHLSLLQNIDEPCAVAICSFFRNWDYKSAESNQIVAKYLEEFKKGANITFLVGNVLASQIPDIQSAWKYIDDNAPDDCSNQMRCIVTGEKVIPARTHPTIKHVKDAKAEAMLVSFNAKAFESYDREQNYNAPVGKYAAFAYTSALNYLLSDSKHTKYIGDAAVVYWAKDGSEQCRAAFSAVMDGGDDKITDKDLNDMMSAVSAGRPFDWDGLPLSPENDFYVLGISPNAARLSVRFFYRNTFGGFVSNIKKHYDDIYIAPDGHSPENIWTWMLLRETVNPNANDKTPSPQMAGETMGAILTGGRYPATLYGQAMLRIRAERKVSRGRAAIIKAYLIRNCDDKKYREAATVSLNEQNTDTAYILGRLFSALESIQDSASGATTVKDMYFNSACATPSAVFPQLMKLEKSHMKVLKREKPGLAVNYDKLVGELMNTLGDHFPKHLSMNDQGAFILGYYHQTQKRYEKKDTTAEKK